ncbi:Outer membrane protein beta-barrel domain-containing protein [Algoriphagus alkaliphilus]|uniref:Outer membrane protein beta-barrel domain-containing protein n=1 Tax=Algoriphagus alkaliphilus TaxID=279824 RepID=A0A1G5YFZ8_9BACT|nr:outer membrane beta-barrel protein [Algoriphagus alkaliphilus]SDA80957.1 Outer membrane protein beta-barrel domain-containing protein [Algoriphagus alkaliphilus]
MRKLLVLILAVGFWSIESKAQMQKGSWIMEGSAGFERSRSYFPNTDEKSNPVSGFSLHPKAGYFVSDNLAIGVSGLLGNTLNRNKDFDQNIPYQFKKSNQFTYGAGVFIRKYMPINESLSFFSEVGSEFSWVKNRVVFNEPAGEEASQYRKTVSAQGILGLQYLISSKLGVHIQTNLIQYERTQFSLDSDHNQYEFRAGFLINPRFGFTIFL